MQTQVDTTTPGGRLPGHEESEQDLISLLSGVPIFRGVSALNLRSLVRRAAIRHYPPDDRLFRQGSRCHELYVVMDGSVELRLELEAGRSKLIDTVHRGKSFGEIGFFTLKPRTLTAVAGDEGARTLVLGREDFATMIAEDPAVGLAVYHHLFGALASRLGALPGYLQNYILSGHRPTDRQIRRMKKRLPMPLSRTLALGGLVAGWLYLLLSSTIEHPMVESFIGGRMPSPRGSLAIFALVGAFAGWLVGLLYQWKGRRLRYHQPHARSCSNCKYAVLDPGTAKLDCVFRTEHILSMVIRPGLTADGFTDCPSFQGPIVNPDETPRPAAPPRQR